MYFLKNYSCRKISRETGFHRSTVDKYLKHIKDNVEKISGDGEEIPEEWGEHIENILHIDRSRKKRKITKNAKREVIEASQQLKTKSPTEIRSYISENPLEHPNSIELSVTSIWRILNEESQ